MDEFEKQIQEIANITQIDNGQIKRMVEKFARTEGISMEAAASYYNSCSKSAIAAK